MRIALYAGTFDPITRGHLSVIERAARLFDRLLVVVAVNPDKRPLFAPVERVEMIRQVVAAWDNVSCAVTEDYVVHLARQVGARRWGPGRFSAALHEAARDGRIHRVGRRRPRWTSACAR